MVSFNGFNIQWLAGAVIMILLLATTHYVPWSWFFGKKLPRLCSYTVGGVCILIGIVIYLPSIAPRAIVPIISLFALSGAAVVVLYGVDLMAVNTARERRSRDKEKDGQ